MEELSIEEKSKRYDEALHKAKNYYSTTDSSSDIKLIGLVFPELKESEDERIRKWLICYFKEVCDNVSEKEKKGVIDWLEKQGEQKSNDALKFKIGDWVVFNNKHQSIYQVEKIEGGYYILRHTHGGTLRVCVLHDESLRPWTIQDANDGDVLACNEEILLFKSYSVQGRISLHCWYNGQTNNFYSKEVVDTLMTTRNKICPATKEQRDTLMKAMADAGYTFDFEKKELKKIEQKPNYCHHEVDLSGCSEEYRKAYYDGWNNCNQQHAQFEAEQKSAAWNEEDEKNSLDIKRLIGSYRAGKAEYRLDSWIDSLKDRVQPKQEWSEEDKRKIDRIYSVLWQAADTHAFSTTCRLIGDKECVELQDFLKSLRPQNTWKPSDEQIKVCKEVYADILSAKGFDLGTINSELNRMEEQLNKLKENKL